MAIERLAANGDSCGGIVECRIRGLHAGVGEPVFDKLDAEFAKAMLSIGAVKGIEFGAGFAAAEMLGSEHNDQMDRSGFLSNHAGGIDGGISTGEVAQELFPWLKLWHVSLLKICLNGKQRCMIRIIELEIREEIDYETFHIY